MIAAFVCIALVCLQGISAFPNRALPTPGVSLAEFGGNNPLAWGAIGGLLGGHSGLDAGGYSAVKADGSYAGTGGYAGVPAVPVRYAPVRYAPITYGVPGGMSLGEFNALGGRTMVA